MTHKKLMEPVGPDKVVGPDCFGPSLWQGLHYITLGYPDNPDNDKKQKYKAFFTLLKYTLPCSICANHYAENLEKMPITDTVLETKENLVKWLIDFHNIVNKMKGKPEIDYKIARKMIDTDIHCEPDVVIEKFEAKTNEICDIKLVYGLIGILVTLILIAVVYKKN
jgi:hypothetical protein